MSYQIAPFPDQSHINRIRDSLWNRPNAGASVMVGSGFSRNADKLRSDSADLPLWPDLTDEIVKGLFPGVEDAPRESPLRLAQQYETAFGRSDLHRLLGKLVRDNDFTPGETHSRLLILPWRDVFTTNWDTLLERASSSIPEPSYNVVQDMDQLPLLSQPRIIKLHGSFPSQFPLILTEEDYRTYPAKYAPFVNTVQQAMMETVFCLIGFSGDDPNFLNWSGWVRDNLGEAAPKIYLAGLLRLSPHQRRMLEDRGVVPIDVWNHPRAQLWPEHRRHQYAAQWILHTLENGEPYDLRIWPSPPEDNNRDIPDRLEPVAKVPVSVPRTHGFPGSLPNSPTHDNESLEEVKQILDTWAHNRKLYPGWLVFPSGPEHIELSQRTYEWEPSILNALPTLSPVEQLYAVRELAWRREILLEPITPRLEDAAMRVLESIDCQNRAIQGHDEEPEDWTEVREAWLNVAFLLVTDARYDCKKSLFEERLKSLEPFEDDSADVAHRIQQERCLWALYNMGYSALNALLDNWRVDNGDPVWMLRKAAILTEVRRHDEAVPLVQDALNSFRRAVAAERSIPNASRMSWALASTLTAQNNRSVSRKWEELGSLKCHAGNEIARLTRTMQGTDKRKDAPSYDYGVRRGERIQWSIEPRNRLIAAYRTVRLPEVAGLPPATSPGREQFGSLNILSESLTLAADELASLNPDLAMRLVLRVCSSDTDETLRRVFSRTNVANLTEDSAESIAQICTDAIQFMLPRLFTPDERNAGISLLTEPRRIGRMTVALEVLSRLVPRLKPDSANIALDLGLQCYGTEHVAQHPLLTEPVGNLLKRSWEVLPIEHRRSRVFDLLTAPIMGMDGFAADRRCPDPGVIIDREDLSPSLASDDDARYREVIEFLLRGLHSDNDDARGLATLRLLRLADADGLTGEAKKEIASAIWSDSDRVLNDSPSPFTPLDWTFMLLPELTRGQAELSFRRKWLTPEEERRDENEDYSGRLITELGNAFEGLKSRGRTFPLTDEENELIRVHLERLVGVFSSSHIRITNNTVSAAECIGAVFTEITIPDHVAEELFEKTESMLAKQSFQSNDFFASFDKWAYELRVSVAYALIPGLARSLPNRFDEFVMWLSAGLASGEGLRVTNSVSALRDWMSVPIDHALIQTPDGPVREVGYIISSRNREGLGVALSFANWVFDQGSREHRDAISPLVVHGLSSLAEEMQYDRHQDDLDVPDIRLRCVKLASSMSNHGFEDHPIIQKWLEIGKDDPFPEVRNAVASSKMSKACSVEHG